MKVFVTILLVTVSLCYVESASKCYHCDKTLCSDPKDKETCPRDDDLCVTATLNNVINYRGCKSLDLHKDPPVLITEFSYSECDGNLCNNFDIGEDPDYNIAATTTISLLCLLFSLLCFFTLS